MGFRVWGLGWGLGLGFGVCSSRRFGKRHAGGMKGRLGVEVGAGTNMKRPWIR